MEPGAARLRAAVDALAGLDPSFARALARIGHPEPRISEPGYETLLRTIVGQQVSVASARALWRRLEASLGDPASPARLLDASDETLRAAGLSRQKTRYARSLAALVRTGALDLARLPEDDEDAIGALVRVDGIGRWSAEIYLLFAEGRPDIWPAGDLAIRIATADILGLEPRASERIVRAAAQAWRPHRSAAAVFAWHHYNARARPVGGAVPL